MAASKPCIDCWAPIEQRVGWQCGLTSPRCDGCRRRHRRESARRWYRNAKGDIKSARCLGCGLDISRDRSAKGVAPLRCGPCGVSRNQQRQREYARRTYRPKARARLSQNEAMKRRQESKKRYIEKHPDRNRASKAAYTERNRATIMEKNRRHALAWMRANPELHRQRLMEWREKNKPRVLQYARDRRTNEILSVLPADAHEMRLLLREYRAFMRRYPEFRQTA